jgi:phage antirepressor YoqD-like protein
MGELWYPPKEPYEKLGVRKVTQYEIDRLSNPRLAKLSIKRPRKFKIGQIYKTSKSDVEIVHYQGGESVCVKMLDSGMIIEHYPVRAVFSMRKQQPKEIQPMQAATQQQITQFNQATMGQPIQFGAQATQPDDVTMTSLELVDFINTLREQQGETVVLRHESFLTKVSKVLGTAEQKFLSCYKGGNGKELPMYVFPKREATLMAMSYSHEVSAQVYDKMDALEKEKLARTTVQIPQDYAEAMMAAALALAQNKQQQIALAMADRELTLAAPKVAFVDNFVGRGENLTATMIGKKLNISAYVLNKWLIRKDALFRNRKHFCQWYVDKGYGVEKFVSARHSGGRVVSSIYHTPAGAEWILSNFKLSEV